MARYSPAYSNLVKRLKEIETLVSLAQGIVSVKPKHIDFERSNTLCRSGIVLLCSHLEGYIKFLGTIGVERIATNRVPKNKLAKAFRFHLSRKLITSIRESTDPEVIVEKIDLLLENDLPIWDNTPSFAPPLSTESFVESFSTPKHKNNVQFLRRFGYCSFNNDLRTLLQGRSVACINMIDNIVDQRNKIAHGDYSIEGSPVDLKEMFDLLKLYCVSTDHVVGNWFKRLGCAIR